MELVYLVMVLALLEYMIFAGLVGRARARYGVQAPAISGHEIFDRTFRVHQNTLEGLVIFLPAIWLFGVYVDARVAAGVGVVGIIGRAVYARAYIADPAKRGPGAGICGLVNVVLVLGSVVGLIAELI